MVTPAIWSGEDPHFNGNGARPKTAKYTVISVSNGILTVTDLNDFNGPTQTTNLGVRSSNLFGRAIQNKTANSYVIEISMVFDRARNRG